MPAAKKKTPRGRKQDRGPRMIFWQYLGPSPSISGPTAGGNEPPGPERLGG
jgi:hypothetical protein